MPSNQQHFRTEFVYVYQAEQWHFPITPLLEGPNLALNRSVPRMTKDETRVAIYCQTITSIINDDRKHIPQYWNPDTDDLSDEHFCRQWG